MQMYKEVNTFDTDHQLKLLLIYACAKIPYNTTQ